MSEPILYTLMLISSFSVRDSYNPDVYYEQQTLSIVERHLERDYCEAYGNAFVINISHGDSHMPDGRTKEPWFKCVKEPQKHIIESWMKNHDQ